MRPWALRGQDRSTNPVTIGFCAEKKVQSKKCGLPAFSVRYRNKKFTNQSKRKGCFFLYNVVY